MTNPAFPAVNAGLPVPHQDTPLSTQVLTPAQAMEDEDTIDLRHYWDIIVKRKGTVLAFFTIVLLAVAVGTMLMTRIYRASLTLQVERQEAKVMDVQQVTPNESTGDSRDFYQTQYELLKSRTLAQRVIDQLNLASNPTFAQKSDSLPGLAKASDQQAKDLVRQNAGLESPLVGQFLANLTIEPVRNSRLIKVYYESTDPQLAARIVNALAQSYISLNLERRMDASSYATTFLQERLEQVRVKLEDSERALNQFARDKEIIRLDDKQSSVDSQTLQEYTIGLAKAQQERIQAESIYRQLKSTRNQGIPDVLQNPTIQNLKQSKAKLEGDYQDGLKVYKPSYPKMLQLEAQIAEVQARINDEINNVSSAITITYQAAKAKEEMISAELQKAKAGMLNLQDRSVQYGILLREADTNRQLYEGLLQRMKEVGVAGGVGLNNISVVDKAETPNRPFKPKLLLNLMIGAFLGLFGGIGLALLFEHLDDTIKHAEDVERGLGLPVLGIIPMLKKPANPDQDLSFESINDTRSGFAEAYRSLRTALQFSTPSGVPKVLMITSASMGEGKSTTSISLGISLAQTGKNVLLIDADLRKASLHKKLGTGNEKGLTNLLAGDAQAVDITCHTGVPNLFLIPAGPLPPNPAELLASAKMASLLSLATEKFDQVIIDGPPVLGLADALLLGNLSQATAMVIESESTRKGFARDAIKRLRAAHTRLLGGILTKVEAGGRGYGYYNSYYYYYQGATEQQARLTG
ncbi:MAG: polysaccharide biosynthesis tyrosine autokinase [Hydrogenophilaceae bacterium]